MDSDRKNESLDDHTLCIVIVVFGRVVVLVGLRHDRGRDQKAQGQQEQEHPDAHGYLSALVFELAVFCWQFSAADQFSTATEAAPRNFFEFTLPAFRLMKTVRDGRPYLAWTELFCCSPLAPLSRVSHSHHIHFDVTKVTGTNFQLCREIGHYPS